MAGFFSVAGFYHRYYLTMLAPGVAALVGLGIAVLWQVWQRRGWAGLLGWALPVVLVGSALVQRHILADYPTWSTRLATPVLGLSIAAAAIFVGARLLRWRLGARAAWVVRPARVALVVGVLALLLTPAVWSGISVQAAGSGMAGGLPVAGPAGSGGFGGPGGGGPQGAVPAGAGQPGTTPGSSARGDNGTRPDGQAREGTEDGGVYGAFPGGQQPGANDGTAADGQNRNAGGGMGQVDAQLMQWLIANQGDAKYLVAVSSAGQAESIILQTGLPVMATGGFSGSDPILTADSLAQLVASGTVRYFIVGGGMGGGGFGGDSTFSVASWVQQHGTLVPASTWGSTSSNVQLYEVK
jgi:hypothetical protein